MTSLRTRGLTVSSALPTYASHPAGEAPCLASSPLSQTSCAIPGPQPDGFYFCVSLQNYSNKPITSCSGKWAAPHPIVSTKPDFHSPCWFTLPQSAIPLCLCMACSGLLPGWELCDSYTAVILIYPVLGISCPATSYCLGRRMPPSPTRCIGSGQNRRVRRLSDCVAQFCFSTLWFFSSHHVC